MEKSKKSFITRNKKEQAFISVFILFSILLFFSFVSIEYEILMYLSKSRMVERQRLEKLREEALLEAMLQEEFYRMESFFQKEKKKELQDYICCNEKGEHLIAGDWNGLSVGGYSIRSHRPIAEGQEKYKLYYYKNFIRAEEKWSYEIQVLVEYSYGKEKSLDKFIDSKIREVRIYLR